MARQAIVTNDAVDIFIIIIININICKKCDKIEASVFNNITYTVPLFFYG